MLFTVFSAFECVRMKELKLTQSNILDFYLNIMCIYT